MADLFSQLGFDPSVFLTVDFYSQFALAAIVFVITFVILRIVKSAITTGLRKLSEKTETQLDDAFVDILDHLGFLFYVSLSLYAASKFVAMSPIGETIINYIFLISIIYYSVRAVQRLIDFFTDELVKKRKAEGDEEDLSVVHLGNQILKYAIWVIAILLLLANAGIDVTPLLAGASIGGLAIAFALQNILIDVFASFSIYFDKPFKVGDFITIGTDSGTVKKIGIKTTRLQTLQGEELIISNRQLTESRINNFKRMNKRRVIFTFGVTYQTDVKKLEKIPKLVKDIIVKNMQAEPDRVHFKKLSDSSLDFEVVYFVKSNDMVLYMDTQEQINLEIMRQFKKEKIDFAYPTRTLYVEKGA